MGENVAETASSLSSAHRTRTRFRKTIKEGEEMSVERFRHHPEIVKSITVDNVTEFALHDEVEVQLKTRVFFAHAYSPWERGLNDNTNGLIRRFYPKGTDFSA